MEQNVIQFNDGITTNVELTIKSIIYAKKNVFGILVHVIVKGENIQQVLWMIQQLCVMKLKKF